MGNTSNEQINGTPGYLDFAFYNASGADIPAGAAVQADTTHVLSGTQDGPGVQIYTGADGLDVLGVAMEIIKTGGTAGRVRCGGIAQMTANGSITAGGAVMGTADAAKMAKASAGGKAQIGYALNTVGDGDDVLVLIALAHNA